MARWNGGMINLVHNKLSRKRVAIVDVSCCNKIWGNRLQIYVFLNWYNDIYVVVINYLLSGYLAIIGYYLTNLIVFVKKKKKSYCNRLQIIDKII